MSHKRSLKRSRGSFAEIPGLFSPSTEYVPTKRSKLEEHAEVEESSSVRRSSRAPKPKMFDDEYVDTFRSSFDENEARGKKEKVLVEQERRSSSDSSLNVFESDASVRRSSRVPKPKSFDEDYIDSPKAKIELKANERESVKKTTEELSPVVDFAGAKLQKVQLNTKEDKKEKRKRKSFPDEKSETFIDKNTHGDQKVKKSGSKKLNFSIDSLLHGNPLSRTDDDAAARGGDATGESSKVRQSRRTPVPKKTFALIEDPSLMSNQDGCLISEEDSEDVDVEGISSPKTSHRSSKKHKVSLSSPLIDPSTPGCSTSSDIPTPVSLEQGKKKGKSKSHVEEKPKKKLKKVKPDSGMLVGSEMLPESLSDVPVLKASFEESSKKTGKDKIKKTSTKASTCTVAMRSEKKHADNKEDTSFEVGEKAQAKKKSKKKVSQQGELQGTVDANVVQSPPASEKVHSKHSSSEHGKKPHSKHTKTKHDKAHSEIKDQDQHIILKLHLPHAEGSAHTHSHKKHKHKHHSTSETKTEGSSGDAKSKKRKLSLESASPTTKEQTPKKKVSIKFKGLSSNKPGVEVEVGCSKSPLPLSGVEKVVKEPETKKKKAKKKIDNVEATPTIPSDEQEHLKMVIKKKKKEVKVNESGNENTADKTQIKESKTKPKEPKAVIKVEGNEAKPKASPKKKSKASDTPSKSPKAKEKRKVITGYLLFCKKERSIIAETNPGLEFVEISKKVGIAWNNLTDNEKQKWRDKANNMKARLGVDKKEEKKPEPARGGPDSVDMAAHLKLLGESLSLIGVSLMAQRETEVHGSLSVLLDSILCAICPLTFLTSHIPGIPGITKDKQVQILDDLAYTMPGLG